MKEDAALERLSTLYPSEVISKLRTYVALLVAENDRQNLIARSTVPEVWGRHILDSAQLVGHAPAVGLWLDIGSGGGLPGLVVAIIRPEPTILCEPRRLRAEFLVSAANEMGLSNVAVFAGKAANYTDQTPAVVSARAVAPIDDILSDCAALTDLRTLFVLPRGKSAMRELDCAKRKWQGVFHVKPSVTSDEAGIVVATEVKRR